MDIEVVVRLTYPVTNRPDEKTTDTGRCAELTIEDGASGETLVRVRLSPAEHLALMASEVTRVSEGAWTSDHLDRVGKEMQVETRRLGLVTPGGQIAAEAVAAARAEGWDEVTEGRSNRGPVVTCRRWVAVVASGEESPERTTAHL